MAQFSMSIFCNFQVTRKYLFPEVLWKTSALNVLTSKYLDSHKAPLLVWYDSIIKAALLWSVFSAQSSQHQSLLSWNNTALKTQFCMIFISLLVSKEPTPVWDMETGGYSLIKKWRVASHFTWRIFIRSLALELHCTRAHSSYLINKSTAPQG